MPSMLAFHRIESMTEKGTSAKNRKNLVKKGTPLLLFAKDAYRAPKSQFNPLGRVHVV